MNQLFEWLSRLAASWKFWIVVPPWDVGVRVRLGKVAATLQPGLHFRVPGLDEIALVNTRLRLTCTPTVTIPGSTPAKARVITAQVAFSIVDPVKAMLAYTFAESVVSTIAQACVAEGLSRAEALARMRQELEPNGVTVSALYFIEDVEVRTYRLLNGGAGGNYSGSSPMPPMAVGSAGPTVASY